jgi:hypothetical protein
MAGVIPQDDSVARLPILESTVKQLYGTATICAYPTCDEPLLSLDPPVKFGVGVILLVG